MHLSNRSYVKTGRVQKKTKIWSKRMILAKKLTNHWLREEHVQAFLVLCQRMSSNLIDESLNSLPPVFDKIFLEYTWNFHILISFSDELALRQMQRIRDATNTLFQIDTTCNALLSLLTKQCTQASQSRNTMCNRSRKQILNSTYARAPRYVKLRENKGPFIFNENQKLAIQQSKYGMRSRILKMLVVFKYL